VQFPVAGLLSRTGGQPRPEDRPKLQDAQSEAIRKKATQWYENTLLSRLDGKVRGAIVLVMQCLHLEDLAGHLVEKGGFEHLCLPAIAEKREVMFGRSMTSSIPPAMIEVIAVSF
jgi:hypothetical protein